MNEVASCSKSRAALIAYLVAVLLYLATELRSFARVPTPQLAGMLLAGPLALWAMSGVSLFFSRRENVLRNWLVTLVVFVLLTVANEVLK